MTYEELNQKIEDFIYENVTEDISGDDMQMILKDITSFAKTFALSTFRNGIVSLNAGSNTVTFSSPLGDDGLSYTLEHPYVYDADGNNVDFNIYDRTANGFKIKVPVDCTLNYKATLINE